MAIIASDYGLLGVVVASLVGIILGIALAEWRRVRRRPPLLPMARSTSKGSPTIRQVELNHVASNSSVASCSSPPGSTTRRRRELRRRPSMVPIEDRRKVYGLGRYSQYNRVMLCMVGLPARGKSYIVKMLMRYLQWTGFPVKAFNAGNYRRQEGMAAMDAKFFSNDDKDVCDLRERIASHCMEEALAWLVAQSDVCVAIFDATNTTKKRRRLIYERCAEQTGITPVFVESICDDPKVLEQNYSMKLGNDDYKNQDPAQARADFLERVAMYEQRYETVDDNELDESISYIKLFNVGQKVVMRHTDGYVPSHIGFYLSNIHIQPRRIWLSRHAESEDQLKGILGSASGELTDRGEQYAERLSAFVYRSLRQVVELRDNDGHELLVLMGTAPIHKATFDAMVHCDGESGLPDEEAEEAAKAARNYPAMSTSLLNELDGGNLNGMSYEQIQSEYPDIWAAREKDRLNYRYPGAGGESYSDVIARLRPVIIELERQRRSVLVISHLAVQRCIYGYFTGCRVEDLPYLDLDMHTVYELRPGPFGTEVVAVRLDGESPFGA